MNWQMFTKNLRCSAISIRKRSNKIFIFYCIDQIVLDGCFISLLFLLLFSRINHYLVTCSPQRMATTGSRSCVLSALGWPSWGSLSFCTTTCRGLACPSPSCAWSIRRRCACSTISSQWDQTSLMLCDIPTPPRTSSTTRAVMTSLNPRAQEIGTNHRKWLRFVGETNE